MGDRPAASATLAPVHAPGRLTGLKLTQTRSHVVITWKRSRGATVYALRQKVAGGPAYTTCT